MTIDQVDTDASTSPADVVWYGSGHETWAPGQSSAGSADDAWQETTSNGTLLRRQFVFVPSCDPWDAVNRAREAVQAGAPGVLRLSPGPMGHRYPLLDWVLEPLPAVCEREGYALAIDSTYSGVLPLAEWATFACSAPEVPLVLLGDKLCGQPVIWRFLDRCPNVLLQISNRTNAAHLAAIVENFGAHRFVFGSGGTARTADEKLLAVLREDDRVALLSGNARDLDSLGWRERWL